MMSAEYQEVNRWLSLPFVWGECDCILILGDWIARVRGIDPFAKDRMTYDSFASCQRVTKFFSDPVGVLEDRFAVLGGLDQVYRPAPGDIAVLDMAGQRHPVGGLWLGQCWAIKAPEGATTVVPEAVTPLAIWRVRDAA